MSRIYNYTTDIDELFNYCEPDFTYGSDVWKIQNKNQSYTLGYASEKDNLDINNEKLDRETVEDVKWVYNI